MVQYGRPSRSSWAKSVRSSFGRTVMGKVIWENPIQVRLEEGFQLGNAYSYTVKKDYFYLCVWMTSTWLGKKQNINPMWKIPMKDVDLGGPTSFFDHVYLGCTQRECQTSKDIVDNYPNMFESRISAGAVEKLPVSEKSGANIRHGPMTSKVMQRSAWKEIANWQTKQLNSNTKSQHHAMTTTNLKKKWDLLENCLQFALSLWNACTWLVLDDLLVVRKQTCSCSHEMDWSLWQTCSAFDLQHSSHMLIHTKLLCGKHGTTMQIRIVSRFWFCGRPWRLKINIRKTLMHFRKSNICTNK